MIDAIRPDAVGVIAPRRRDDGLGPVAGIELERDVLDDVVKMHLRAHVREMDREARVVHLARERLLEGARHVVAAVEVDDVPRHERGIEEREALDVIPVHVAEEEMRSDRHVLQQRLAEEAQARAAVEDEEELARPHFHAARVAADADGVRSRARDAAPDAPKGDPH